VEQLRVRDEAQSPRLTLDTIKIARAVLVDGKRPAEAGQENGMSRQRVNAILKRFEAAAQEVPKDWCKIEVWLPPELAAQVGAMAEKARTDCANGASFDIAPKN